MKTFYRKDLTTVASVSRSGTGGYQVKYTHGDYFVKQQLQIGADLRDDWKVEIFASKIGQILGIPVIQQEPCIIRDDKQTLKGVYSVNLERKGMHFCSFDYMLRRNRIPELKDTEAFRHADAISKIKYICRLYNRCLHIPYEVAEQYMINTALIDILVCNPDRHTRNFGVWVSNGTFSLYPIFDNGLGFGMWVQDSRYYTIYEDYMREAYVNPYGEDPFVMLRLLNKAYNVNTNILKSHLKELRSVGKIGYPNDFAREYYHNILRAVEG